LNEYLHGSRAAANMKENPKHPVMADVARLAGCDASTVSLALRRDPRISAATREKVERAAAELGYRVHPMVAAWVSKRRARNPAKKAVPLAYLTSHPKGVDWSKTPHFISIMMGAHERVKEFGYEMIEYRLADYSGRLPALNRVWLTRAVQGVIIGPTLQEYALTGLDLTRLCAVTVGYALSSPVLHRVTEDHYYGMKLAFEACLAQGHRRVGLAITGKHHQLRLERWVGAYLAEQHQRLEIADRLPLFLLPNQPPGEVALAGAQRWLHANRPSMVLADQPRFWQDLKVRCLGFAISGAEPSPGVHENNQGIGRHAADLLMALLQRNERGSALSRQTVLVEPGLHG
jgi:LacI family transcriptional regulator